MSDLKLSQGDTCSVCDSDNSYVVRSEEQRRRRECKKCGHRWTTLELHLADYNRLLEIAKTAQKLTNLVGDLN